MAAVALGSTGASRCGAGRRRGRAGRGACLDTPLPMLRWLWGALLHAEPSFAGGQGCRFAGGGGGNAARDVTVRRTASVKMQTLNQCGEGQNEALGDALK